MQMAPSVLRLQMALNVEPAPNLMQMALNVEPAPNLMQMAPSVSLFMIASVVDYARQPTNIEPSPRRKGICTQETHVLPLVVTTMGSGAWAGTSGGRGGFYSFTR